MITQPQNKKDKLINSLGFTLIEIMVTVAIVSVGVYAVTTYFTQINKTHNTIIKRANERNIVDRIYRELSKPTVCASAFYGLQVPSIAEVDQGLAELKLNNMTFPIGTAAMGPGLVTLSRLRFDTTGNNAGVDITNNNPFGTMDLLLEFDRGRTFLGGKIYTEIIPISVKVRNTIADPLPTRIIDQCHAGVDPLEGQWSKMTTNDDMYYNKLTYDATGDLVNAKILIGLNVGPTTDASWPRNIVLKVGHNEGNTDSFAAETLKVTEDMKVKSIAVNATGSRAGYIRIPILNTASSTHCSTDLDICSNGALWIEDY